jgi:uncharacterized protein YdaU (DUF1376 family)
MTRGKARHVDFYFDEYIAGVAGSLNAEEQGAYWMICALIMSEGGPIENNPRRLAMLCGVRPADIKRLIEKLIRKGKIRVQSDGKLCQNRAQSEVEKSLNRIQSASERGSKGGRPNGKIKENQPAEKAPGSFPSNLTTNHQPPTSNLEVKEEPTGSSKKRAYRLASNWTPPPEWIEEAVGKGMPRATAVSEAERMKNWSLSTRSGAKLDWLATWRNWYSDKIDGPAPRGKTAATEKARLFGRM